MVYYPLPYYGRYWSSPTYSYTYYQPLRSYSTYYWPSYTGGVYRYYSSDVYPTYPTYTTSKVICTTPISSYDYSYYPYTSRYYKPLSLYYNYYWPIGGLNTYSYYWPKYYTNSLDYKYTYPTDRNCHLFRLFDDETRLIRAQTASLLKKVHCPVPRVRTWPLTYARYEDGLPARFCNDNYICKMLSTSPRNPKVEYVTYSTQPMRKYIGQGHLSCVSYAGDRAYNRRRNVWLYEDPLKNDIQLLSYYIQKFRAEKGTTNQSTEVKKHEEKQSKPEITEITENNE